MTDRQITKLKESLFKQEIRGLRRIIPSDMLAYDQVQIEIKRANKIAEILKKLREQ